MERRHPQEGRRGEANLGKLAKGESSSEFSLFDQIQSLAHQDARSLSGEIQNTKFLMAWWSNHYNRPLRDPLLLSYTLEELAYEYFNASERKKADGERIEKENDKIEEAKTQEAEDWADAMEAEDATKAATLPASKIPIDPAEHPDNKQWMDKMMSDGKEEFGDAFGDDLSLDFGK